MDTASLIIFGIGAVLIAVGLPLFYIGRYLSAPEDQKKQKSRDIIIVGVAWVAAGVLIYIINFIFKLVLK